MKIGFRTPSLKRRIAARTSPRRFLAHSLGFKMPRGTGILRNPKKAIYNKIYNKTTVDPLKTGGDEAANFFAFIVVLAIIIWFVFF